MMEWIENLNQLPLLTGPIFIIAGGLMLLFPPKKINYFYGYRTMSSMRSQERWDFSQKYSSILMIKIGFFMLPISLFGLLEISESIINSIIILSVFLPILITEIALRKKFAGLK